MLYVQSVHAQPALAVSNVQVVVVLAICEGSDRGEWHPESAASLDIVEVYNLQGAIVEAPHYG